MALFGDLVSAEFLIAFAFGASLVGLLALMLVPAVHSRAVRITRRRFEAGLPRTITQVKAEKDQLKVDFAVATTKLESNIAELRDKTHAHVSAIAKNTKIIAALKAELEQRDRRISELEERQASTPARERSLRDELHAAKEELAAVSEAKRIAEAASAERQAERDALEKALNERTRVADQQRSEIAVLRGQVEAIRREVIAFAGSTSGAGREPANGPADIRGLAAAMAAGNGNGPANGHGNGNGQYVPQPASPPDVPLAPVPDVPAPKPAPPKPFGQRGGQPTQVN